MKTDDLAISVIRRAWNRATSASPEQWTRQNPALGQCAITAVVVQEALGGLMVRTVATLPDGETVSHYANLLDDGVILDLTDSQFPEGTEFGPWEERTREYVMSYPATAERFAIFARRLNELGTLDRVGAAS